MPTLPNMRFFNPFNMFRSRENTNSGFSLFPSFFSKSDKDGNFARESGVQSLPFQPNHTPSNSHKISSHEENTKFLRNIKSQPSKQEGGFTFMPHLPPVFRNNEIPSNQKTITQLQPPPATHYSLSKPLLQPPPVIHNLNQQTDYVQPNTIDNIATENTDTPTSLNVSSPENSEEAIFIVSPDKTDSLEWQKTDDNGQPSLSSHSASTATVVNPQTNPARQSIFQKETKDIHLGPPLIRFTLDDVVKSPKTLHEADYHVITEAPHTPTHNFKQILFADDMDFSPSEEAVTVAEFFEAQEHVTPISLLMQNVKPTARSDYISTTPVVKKEQIFTTTPKTQESFTYGTPKTTLSSTTLNINGKNLLQITTSPKFIPTTTQNNNSPASFTTYISTIKPLRNNTTQTPDSTSFPQISWMISQPEDTDTKKIPENTEKSNQDISAAESSKITIIEATPMPKEGEVFPTVKHFDTYTTTPTRTSTTTKTALTQHTETKSVTTTNNNLHTNNQQSISTKDQNSHEVLLPGSSNHRTMNKLPRVELEPTVNTKTQSTSKGAENNSNKLKIRYNAPPRKVFQAHRGELQSSVIKGTPSTSTVPTTVPEKWQDHHSTPSSTTVGNQEPITQASLEITSFISHPAAIKTLTPKESKLTFPKELHTAAPYEDSITQSSAPTTATVRSFLVGKPSRYNSLQRLKDSMSRRRTDTNAASDSPFTSPSVPAEHTTKQPFTLTTASTTAPKRLTAISTTNLTRSFPSFRTQTSSKTTTIIRPLEKNPVTITTTTKPQKDGTHLPRQTTNFKQTDGTHLPRQTTNFKQTDYEPSESGSSSSFEWRSPIQDVFLQDHPDMFDITNWESTRLNYPQERSDVQSKSEDFNNRYGRVDTTQSEAFNASPVGTLPTQELTPLPLSLQSSNLSVSPGIPSVILSKQSSLASSSTKVHEETSSSQSNKAWKTMMGSHG